MKLFVIIIFSSFLPIRCYGDDFIPWVEPVQSEIEAVSAEKVGFSGRVTIKINKDLSQNNQPIFEGWNGGLKVKKNVFKLNAVEIVSDNQQINLKQYVENYKKNNKKIDEDERITIVGYDFIKLNPRDLSIFIEIKDFKENVMVSRWNGEDVYIEIPRHINTSGFDLSYNNLFGTTDKKKEMQNFLSTLPELQGFIKEVQNCIIKKDKSCIISKVALNKDFVEKKRQQERVSSNFVRRFVLDDPKTCEIYQNTRDRQNEFDNHIPEGIEKKVDFSKSRLWNSLQDAFELNLETMFVNFESSEYEKGVDTVTFFKKIPRRLSCTNGFDLKMYLVKFDKGWTIKRLELTSFDNDFL